jgi:hypothetical protein
MSNTCINCGCEDAYTSQPACPSPEACPNPQPCAEVFDAQCVSHTLPDILCGVNIVVAQDSNISTALESIVEYMCQSIKNLTACCNSNTIAILQINDEIIQINVDIADVSAYADTLVQSVTGLNTDNTDPRNPIVRVSVDGSTITGTGTPGDPLVATGGGGGIAGSGLNNYVARWTPNSATLGWGVIQDNGSTAGIGSLNPSSIFNIETSLTNGLRIINSYTGGLSQGILSSVVGANTLGVNIGVDAGAAGSTLYNIGVQASVSGSGSDFNIGFNTLVQGSTNTALIGVKSQLHANFTFSSPTEAGSVIHIGNDVDNRATNYGSYISNSAATGVANKYGTYITTIGTQTSPSQVRGSFINMNDDGNVSNIYGQQIILNGNATSYFGNSTIINPGGSATSTIGHYIEVQAGAPTRHALQLKDGTETISGGKFLRDMGSGKANWADLPDPRPYKVLTALVSQTGTNAPTWTVLENTLTELPTLARSSAGVYTINTVGSIFSLTKTILFITHGTTAYGVTHAWGVIGANSIGFNTYDNTNTAADTLMTRESFEIRIYN